MVRRYVLTAEWELTDHLRNNRLALTPPKPNPFERARASANSAPTPRGETIPKPVTTTRVLIAGLPNPALNGAR